MRKRAVFLFGLLEFFFLLTYFSPCLAFFGPEVKKPPPIPFVMSDYGNHDWANIAPVWGPVGGWWDDGPPLDDSRTCFNWGPDWFSKLEGYLKRCSDCKITLDNGQQISKPVGFAVGFPNYSKNQLYAIENFVKQVADRYDRADSPLSFIVICSCDNYGEFSSASVCPSGIINDVIPLFRKHLKKLPTFVQCTTWTCGAFAPFYANDEYPIKNAGVKCNSWRPEAADGYTWLNGELKGGCFGFAQLYHKKIPVGFEPSAGDNNCEIYWLVMEGMSLHPDFLDIQQPYLNRMVSFESNFGFPLLRFIRDHLQKTVNNAPDVWTILKETTVSKICWKDQCQSPRCVPCEYGEAPDPNCKQKGKECSAPRFCYISSKGDEVCSGPRKGNLNYWLYPREDLPQSKPAVIFATPSPKSFCTWIMKELPSPANEHPYSRYSVKRTDQASGNIFLAFDIDDRYHPPAPQGMERAWEITTTLVNQGTDKFSLEYINKSGQIIKKSVKKGENLGQVGDWIDYKWTLNDADFSSNKMSGADFRINCEGDGDEIVHRIMVKPIYVSPSPTILFYPGWQQVELSSSTKIPQNCQVVTIKENGWWENFLTFLKTLPFAPKRKKVWVKCD